MRILLAARKDLTASGTAQTDRLLRALLLAGGDIDCRLARGVLTDLTLASLARRRPPCKHEHETRRSARLGSAAVLGESARMWGLSWANGCRPGDMSCH